MSKGLNLIYTLRGHNLRFFTQWKAQFVTGGIIIDHEMAGKGPKIGERAYAHSPIFGYSLSFREVLIMENRNA
jgi:hypothetical protein